MVTCLSLLVAPAGEEFIVNDTRYSRTGEERKAPEETMCVANSRGNALTAERGVNVRCVAD